MTIETPQTLDRAPSRSASLRRGWTTSKGAQAGSHRLAIMPYCVPRPSALACRLMGRSLDERLAEQLKGMPMHKQQLMVDGEAKAATVCTAQAPWARLTWDLGAGFRQWASFMSNKLKGEA